MTDLRMIPCSLMNATALEGLGDMHDAYRRLFELGRGGMARVYLAESVVSGIRKLVVLKVLNPEFCADPEMRALFRREAELSAQMNHPNVVQVMAVVEYGNTPVIVMEYLDGTPLSLLLSEAGERLPLPLHMHVLSQVLAGLHHFHELRDLDGAPLNTVHRDVSPQNVMVLHDGPVKVLDFGIAKINATNNQVTRSGTIKGKLHYMPPEQLFGESGVDRRADIFAVGVMLWEAVADRRMWEGKSEVELLRSLATGALPKLRDFVPDVPEAVVEIVEHATDFDPENRYATALEMQMVIERTLAQQGWVVHSRELADFMFQHFGERRRAQELKIKSALRTLRDRSHENLDRSVIERGAAQASTAANVTSAVSLSVPPGRSAPPAEVAGATVRVSDSPVTHTLRINSRRWGWLVVAATCSILAGGWTIGRFAAGDDYAAETVAFEVEVLPENAEISLNGKPLGKSHYTGRQPLTASTALLAVSAPGYVSERKELTFSKNIALQFSLKPEAPALPPVASPAAAAPSSAESAAGAPSAVARANPSPPARVSVQNSSRPTAGRVTSLGAARGCNPPYSFTADGVKKYKPECF
ncbi:MAG: serine/threonine protein kinase [Myxococcales bacterium]